MSGYNHKHNFKYKKSIGNYLMFSCSICDWTTAYTRSYITQMTVEGLPFNAEDPYSSVKMVKNLFIGHTVIGEIHKGPKKGVVVRRFFFRYHAAVAYTISLSRVMGALKLKEDDDGNHSETPST